VFKQCKDLKDKLVIIKNTQLAALFATSVVITIILCACNAASVVRYIQYGSEVLYVNANFGSNDQALLYWHASVSISTSSLVAIIQLIPGTYWFIVCLKSPRRAHTDNDFRFHHSVIFSIHKSIVCLGSNFSPYMILAFLHDPLQTSFIYLIIIIGVIFLFLIFWVHLTAICT